DLFGTDGPDLRDGDLEVREDLQQECLEFLVGAIDLVDQQYRRTLRVMLDRLQQGTLEQELVAEDVAADVFAVDAACLLQADLEHLAQVVPLVQGGMRVQAFVALQADE